jgi:uncharacterized protein (DUF1330 family)
MPHQPQIAEGSVMTSPSSAPKGYWIARVDVHDLELYKGYVAAAKIAFEKYGAKFLARGGRIEAVEGVARGRNVIIEFESFEHAAACYHSPEYAKARDLHPAAPQRALCARLQRPCDRESRRPFRRHCHIRS